MPDLPENYDSDKVEKKWRKKWSEMDIYSYNPDSDKPTYSIDTPPPYVSGDLHVGHAMSYTQAEFIARFKRMQGYNVFYPMGFDDNGLPTERYVERKLDVDKHDLGRSEFVQKCIEVTEEGRENYKRIWNRLGISVDWDLLYTTISQKSQRVSQLSFIDLFEKDRMYREEDPVIWCPECRTGLAQADLEDEDKETKLNHIRFPLKDQDDYLTISTTRPELIQACVAVFVHPEDQRYREYVGEEIEVPLADRTVEIKEDHKVDRDFGSGVVMVCTFGDKTDIEWWKDYDLDLHLVINEDGTLNEKAGKYEGMDSEEARKEILQDLEDKGLLEGQKDYEHSVQIHERCDTPVEYFLADQWFVKMLDIKEDLKERASDVEWFPEFMEGRFDDWTDGLKWDWCISRQRFYGVPFPVWYCENCGRTVLAEKEDLPIDPVEEDPPVDKCPNCGSKEFKPEEDVMDTWFTSSLTPLTNADWDGEEVNEDIFPMDLRPQGYDIIRTWAFYTLLKSHLHMEEKPWEDIMISGMGMAEEGVSFSKSRGIVVEPVKVADKYSADALRWWSSKVKLGEDLVYKEDDLVAGEKLITKLWNAGKFIGQFIDEEPEKPDELSLMDKWLLEKMDGTVKRATELFERYEYDRSKELVKQFFWNDLADNYIEIVKPRLYEESNDSSLYVLYHAYLNVVKMLAPIMPFITEEIYDNLYKDFEPEESIHVADWPEKQDYQYEKEKELGDAAIEVISGLRKYKTQENLPLNAELDEVKVFGSKDLGEAKQVVKEAMHVEKLNQVKEQIDMEEKIANINLDYSKLGPDYGNRVKQIEKAVEQEERRELREGKLILDLGGEKFELSGEYFEVEKEFSLEGEEGTLVTTEEFAVLVR
ncbi:MAG: valine--tRNA ligase [Candidatus Nanohaloarchaeota archaeon QJJ-9]|nr:valine--tRNA ligase [Candidatus Nanohaloarchaeota archaeon QJJ-9]